MTDLEKLAADLGLEKAKQEAYVAAGDVRSRVDAIVVKCARITEAAIDRAAAAEAHIAKCEFILQMVANIAAGEKADNWDNVRERLWSMTREFAAEPRIEMKPLQPYRKRGEEEERPAPSCQNGYREIFESIKERAEAAKEEEEEEEER